MQSMSYPVDWLFVYPVECSLRKFRAALREYAAFWLGWDGFPWYLTRTLHRQMDGPGNDWDYLHSFFCIRGLACHTLLKGGLANRHATMELLMEHEAQFPNILRHFVMSEIYWCLKFLKQERLEDCALMGAESEEARAALERKRASFREGIEHAVSEFVRMLDVVTERRDLDEWFMNLRFGQWFGGVSMPDAVEVPVRMIEDDGKVYMGPDSRGAAWFLRRSLPVPKIETCPVVGEEVSAPAGIRCEEAEPDEEAVRRMANGALRIAFAINGEKQGRPPLHSEVLKLYVIESMTVNAIAKRCGCSHGTVMNRKRELEERFGVPLEYFRRHSGMFGEAMKTAEDWRARKVRREELGR
jgi:hypothetical protein